MPKSRMAGPQGHLYFLKWSVCRTMATGCNQRHSNSSTGKGHFGPRLKMLWFFTKPSCIFFHRNLNQCEGRRQGTHSLYFNRGRCRGTERVGGWESKWPIVLWRLRVEPGLEPRSSGSWSRSHCTGPFLSERHRTARVRGPGGLSQGTWSKRSAPPFVAFPVDKPGQNPRCDPEGDAEAQPGLGSSRGVRAGAGHLGGQRWVPVPSRAFSWRVTAVLRSRGMDTVSFLHGTKRGF